MNASVSPLYNNANANVDTCYKLDRHNTCEQLWNGVKKKTDVGGDGFLRAQANSGIIYRVSCLRVCCAPSYGKKLIYLFTSKYIQQHFSQSQDF